MARALFLGAVGIEQETAFAKWRKASEDIAATHNVTILRAGLVMADTSYGGTSLGRALAAFPMVMPLVGGGAQEVNPVHACDLAEVIRDILRRLYTIEILTIGGPEVLTQRAMLESYRRWLSLPKAKALRIPLLAGMALGRIGDALRMGPFRRHRSKRFRRGFWPCLRKGFLPYGRSVNSSGHGPPAPKTFGTRSFTFCAHCCG